MTNQVISKTNGNTESEIKAAFKLAMREAIKQADAEVQRTGQAATIHTDISFSFSKGGR